MRGGCERDFLGRAVEGDSATTIQKRQGVDQLDGGARIERAGDIAGREYAPVILIDNGDAAVVFCLGNPPVLSGARS